MSLWPVQAQGQAASDVSALIEQLGDAAGTDRLAVLAELVDRTYRAAPENAVRYSDEALALLTSVGASSPHSGGACIWDLP